MNQRVKILNADVDNISLDEFLERFTHGFLVTPNVDHLMLLQENRGFYEAYQSADYVTVDSRIVYWATVFLGRRVKEKLSGSDLLPAYYRHHKDNKNIRIFLLGGMPGVAERAAANINQHVGRNIVVGTHSPSMNFTSGSSESDAVTDIVERSGANVLVVGLGAPKQELWIMHNRDKMPGVSTFMALGATLDFEAGTISRAPKWMSHCGFEWLYRLLKEPKRLWRRYLVKDVGFFALVLKQRLGLYKSPF